MIHPFTFNWLLCSYSSRAEWILPKCTVEPNEFQDRARRVGIHRFAFLRHGNTAPAENGVDFDRRLTPLGREQSRQAGRGFGARLRPFRKVLVSPAPRTVETAQLFLEAAASAAAEASSSRARSLASRVSSQELSLVQGLYDGTMQPEGSVLFRKKGYAPLKSYVDASDPADREVAQRVLGEYSTHVAQEIFRTLLLLPLESEPSSPSEDAAVVPATILVVGHAIYLPAAALGISRLCGGSGEEVLLDTNTKEAHGYCIDLQESTVTLLDR